MSRWNISHLIYYSKHGKNRTLEFQLNDVTIITGGSNTGKSAIIDTIDYCLGSSACAIASFVTQRVTHVACKWKNNETEILIAREIGNSGAVSDHMFVEYGTEVSIPNTAANLKGKATKDQAKSVIERVFGFQNEIEGTKSSGKISIRHVTPYIFLNKEVIDSKKNLLFGLDERFFARDIVESMPYFLGAIDTAELEAIKTMSGLKKGIETEEKKQAQYEGHQSNLIEKCKSLLLEAAQIGLISPESIPDTIEKMIALLSSVSMQELKPVVLENDSVVIGLQEQKTAILANINALRRRKIAATQANTITKDFDEVVDKQLAKLNVRKFFQHDAQNCPVCNSVFTTPNEISEQINRSIDALEKERAVVKKHTPSVNTFIRQTEEQISSDQSSLSQVESQIENLLKESELLKNQYEDNQQAIRIVGRISYFLDNHSEAAGFDKTKLERYKSDLDILKQRYGKSRREERIRLAEGTISGHATKNLSLLPVGYPCEDATIIFLSKTPKIVVTDLDNIKHEFANIGSDENYLSIHLAFSFALQKFFKQERSPIPGLLILDQISRPYYSNDTDNEEILEFGDDKVALNKHFDFIFKQVAAEVGLQVIILEHAYLKNDPRFVAATKYIWPKTGSEKLIPSDWPTT